MLFNLKSQIAKPLECPDCDIEMLFLASQPTKRVFVSTILGRSFFLCPNCQRLSHRLVAMPHASYDPRNGFGFGIVGPLVPEISS